MIALGLDVGDRRIGVAASDPTGMLATPLTTIVRESDRVAAQAVGELARARGVDVIVVGLPLDAQGATTGQAERTRAFARKLQGVPGARVVFWDERYTTATASALIAGQRRASARPRSAGRREAERRRLDAAAAAVMLQDYLDHLREGT
jgi:putative Holliday junction resolvase